MAATNKHTRWSEEKISSAVLILLVTMSVVVFALFFGIGYDNAWEENTEFIDPQFTDNLINFMFFMVGAGIIAVAASVTWFLKCYGHPLNVTGGIPTGKIAIGCFAILLITLGVTYITASDSAILINGKSYTNGSWLKITDMLIHTSEVLLVLAVLAVVYGMSGLNRKIQKH